MHDTDLTFRPINRDAMTQLNVINRACPIEADFSLVFERGDDFFQWPDLIYDRYQYIGAFHQNRLIGYMMVGQYCGWTGKEFGVCFYLGDARVLPPFRGQQVARRMIRELEVLLPAEAHLGLSVVKKGNRPAESLASSATSPRYEGHRIGELHVLNIPLLSAPAPVRSIAVRRARVDDIKDMAELFSRTTENRLFAPLMTIGKLRREFRTPLYPDIADCWLAFQDRQLVGMLAVWDMHPFHYTRVLQYSLTGMTIRAAYNTLTRLHPGSSRLPPAGGVLRSFTATHVAIQDHDPHVLRAILTEIIRANLGKGFQFLSIGFAEGNPLLDVALRFPLVQRFESYLICIAHRDAEIELGEGLPYIVLAMI